jgi:uncharacterized membrane protein (UPF0127 family)
VLRAIAIVVVLALVLPLVIGTIVVVVRAFTHHDTKNATSQRPLIPPFGSARFTVGDDPTTYCALLASSVEAQVQGMQNRRDLGGYDAMVFSFPTDENVSFTNHFVPIDLDIGWYDARGVIVDHTTMQKCPDGVDCPTYAARDVFRYAVETPVGGLAGLGLTNAGSTIHVGGAC